MTTLMLDCLGHCNDCDDMLARVRDLMAKDKEVHYHQCGAREPLPKVRGGAKYKGWDRKLGCGTIWKHSCAEIDDDSDDNAHDCPACGRSNYWAYTEAEMRSRNRGKAFNRRMKHAKGLHSKFTGTCAAIFPIAEH